VAALQAALQERDDELAANKKVVTELKAYAEEMKDYVEQIQTRAAELIAGCEPMAKALLLPGVKTFLLNRFHPDKFPDADEKKKEMLNEALKTINAAYASADKLQTSSSEDG
jgi:hypothetical protein